MRRDTSVPAGDYICREWEFFEGDTDARALAEVIASWSRAGNWLDLGCGPMLPVWPMFSPHTVRVNGIDRNPELSGFYAGATACTDVCETHFGAARRFADSFREQHAMAALTGSPMEAVASFRILSVLEPVTNWASSMQTVLQIGCFGCLDSFDQLAEALRCVVSYLDDDGVFISATWVPRAEYHESHTWGGDQLRHLTRSDFESCLQDAGLEVEFAKSAVLDNKKYCERFVLVAKRIS